MRQKKPSWVCSSFPRRISLPRGFLDGGKKKTRAASGGSLRPHPLYRDFRLDAAWRAKLSPVAGCQRHPRKNQLRQQGRDAA